MLGFRQFDDLQLDPMLFGFLGWCFAGVGLVNEGDFASAGQVLARMDTEQLQAQRRQAEAQLQRAIINVETAKSLVNQREAERKAAEAVVD